MTWKQLSSKEIYRNKWMWLTEETVRTDAGKELIFGIPHKHPFATIIPWDGNKLTLVGQYRYMVKGFSWELPQGHFEHSSIEETARTELREETGLVAKNIGQIGLVWVAPGGIDQECNIFLATELEQTEQHLEASEEGLKCKDVTIDEFWAMVSSGTIKDGVTITAVALAERTLKVKY